MESAASADIAKGGPMPTNIDRRYISPADAAEQLGLNVREIHRHISSGNLPASRLSHKTIRIAVADLEHFIASRRIGNYGNAA